MNAHDSGYHREPARSLTEGTLAMLRRAIDERWRIPATPDTELRRALAVVAAEAHARGLRPEELIITLKAMLAELAGRQLNATAADELRMREWVVTACIEAYYHRG